MKNSCKIILLFILVYFISLFGEGFGGMTVAQNRTIDSLLTLLQTDKPDSNKVNDLSEISRDYYNKGLYENALKYANFGLELSQQLNFKKGIAASYNNFGVVYGVYGNYAKSLDYYLKALKIVEEQQDKNGIAIYLGNIGNVSYNQGEFSKALDYFFRALKINKERNNKIGIAINFNCIGNTYIQKKEYDNALDYYLNSLKIAEELRQNLGVVYCLSGIGNVYSSKENYEQALAYYSKALKIAERGEYKALIISQLCSLGSLYIKTKKYDEAEKQLLRALKLDKEIGDLAQEQAVEESIAELYSKTNRYQQALEHYQKAMVVKDTLFNKEKEKEITRHEMNYEFDKKEDALKAKQDKKDAVVIEEKNKQKLVLLFVVCGLFLVVVFAGFVFRSLRITRKQKQIIEIKSAETEHQKRIIEEKNKDITDSIHYAKQIQSALLREQEHVSKHLPEHFILFLPKDIVSGDFYWGFEKREYWYFAAVDCTGHGVPGAVMSMLGISFLNDIVSSEELLSPAEILNRLRTRVVTELRQTGGDGGNKDGMDISLVRLNLNTYELQWSGANNALNLIQAGQLKEVKADKQPIGYHPQQKPFTNHELQLQKGDSIYIYSDGYADQFGGPKGKKLTYKKLENLLLAQNNLPMNVQKEKLKNNFTEWKGLLEQVDDVCIIGVRL